MARSLAEEFHQVADQLDNSPEGVELSDRQHAGMWLLLHGRRAAEKISEGMPGRVRKLIVAALSEGLSW